MKLKYFKAWLALGYTLVALILYLSLTSVPLPGPKFFNADKVGHLLAYAVLMGWFTQLYSGNAARIRLGVSFVCMGIAMEILQGMSPARMFEYADMLANTAGVVIGWWLSQGLFADVLVTVEHRLLRAK